MDANDEIVLFHNPRCSKSRAALELLRGRGVTPRIVEYLKTPPTPGELRAMLDKLQLKAEDIVRKGEDIYKFGYSGRTLSPAEWLAALHQHPILMERPIAVRGSMAVVGRPPEKVLTLLAEDQG